MTPRVPAVMHDLVDNLRPICPDSCGHPLMDDRRDGS